MNQPTECKHCGLHATWHIDDDTFFACGTSWCGRVDVWNQSTGCVEIMRSREQIRRAVEVLEGVARREFVDGFLPHMQKRRDGEWLEWDDAERAIEILRGNAPEIPDSSPITTDDLVVAEERIRRAIDTLKAATRYRVTPVSRIAVEWDTSDDGPVTDSAAVDEAIGILEGERG